MAAVRRQGGGADPGAVETSSKDAAGAGAGARGGACDPDSSGVVGDCGGGGAEAASGQRQPGGAPPRGPDDDADQDMGVFRLVPCKGIAPHHVEGAVGSRSGGTAAT